MHDKDCTYPRPDSGLGLLRIWAFEGRMVRKLAVHLFILVLAGLVFAAPTRADQAANAAGSVQVGGYQLGSGDKLHIAVFGQTDLNGDYVIDGAGNVQLPLVGQVHAAGMTVPEFQQQLTVRLADGFFVNPSVSVDVVNYRPFYIIGEVNKPGEYPYVNGMSILNAVALAGGYTVKSRAKVALTQFWWSLPKWRQSREPEGYRAFLCRTSDV